MEVPPVDERDLHGLVAQLVHRLKPAEAAAHDHDVVSLRVSHQESQASALGRPRARRWLCIGCGSLMVSGPRIDSPMVVLGGGVAGGNATVTLREEGFAGRVVLI